MSRRRGAELPQVARFDREDFIASGRWNHRAGEHVAILGPTGWGKTTLAFQLVAPISTPDAPTIILVMKARDKTVDEFGKANGFKKVRSWPPPLHMSYKRSPARPPGFLLWPRQTFDAAADENRLHHEFRNAMVAAMRRGRGVKVFADEVADLGREGLKLDRTLGHFLRQARSLDAAMISATQRPFNAPMAVYSQSTHLFIGNDPDRNSQKRYEEIGGIDPDVITGVTSTLQRYEWLYIRRPRDQQGPVMCIVGA
jgi:energy-coupling factor transporter ATP-binding protein EcfA2